MDRRKVSSGGTVTQKPPPKIVQVGQAAEQSKTGKEK